ncbi:hypothetical protein VQ042_25295, partial [Aurantimonas sp. A2-1-M11]|uniref:hypothetical protein n=1 Tax=Aurantimonas sp. A2-1-M11 TaxID=3113712 RepID=UPI002F92F2F5
ACLVPASKPAKNGETPYVQTSFRVRRFNGLAIIQGGLNKAAAPRGERRPSHRLVRKIKPDGTTPL